LGVLEGSCLSPFLFSTVFSVVWEFVNCSDFPSGPRVLRLGDIWLIAFADDVVILSVSASRLQEVLARLFSELKEFNLSMNLCKTESLTFAPPRVRSQGSVIFTLDNVQLKQVDTFKYLGIFVCEKWGFASHIARMRGRAEAAAVELVRLATRLDIRGPEHVTVYFKSLVESQWHGLELLPSLVVDEMLAVRGHFMKRMYDLPTSTSNLLSMIVLDLWPPAFDALMRRIAFARRMTMHDLPFVRDVFDYDRTILFRARTGWHYDAFFLFQSLFKREQMVDFSLERVNERLSPVSHARTNVLFWMIRETTEATLAPFRLFSSADVLVSFREFLGQVSHSTAKFVLLICSSGQLLSSKLMVD
jgi:hypothetical protein